MVIDMGYIRLYKTGLKAARVIVLGRGAGHRPSQFNIKVGQCMKRKGIGPTNGGRYDKDFQREFIKCVIEAGGKVRESTRKKWGI